MTRKELYKKVKSLNLAEEVKKVFGDNYTRVSNADLEQLIAQKEAKSKATCNNADFKNVVIRIVSVLQGSHVIGADDAKFILEGF